MLSAALQQLLDKALASLPAWHLLEGLSRAPQRRADLAALMRATALELGEAERAVAQLRADGLLAEDADHALCFAPAHAAALAELCARVEADRELRRVVIKQAARRELAGPQERTGSEAGASPPPPGGSPPPARPRRAPGPSRSAGPAAPAS